MPDPKTHLSLPHYRVRALYEDSTGNIWVGTSLGLLLLNGQGDAIQMWQYNSDVIDSEQVLAGKGVRGIGEDLQGRIWLATEGGLSIYDQERGNVIILREADGLPSNATYCALPVGQYMWVSTLHRLARINTENLQVESYYNSDGVPDNEFNFNAWHQLTDGRLAFGTLSGFTLFAPELAPGPEQPRPAPPLQIQTYIYDEKEKGSPVLMQNEPMVVSWQNNHIAFEYSALHFGAHDSVRYDAFLQGDDSAWNSVGSQHLEAIPDLLPVATDFTFVLKIVTDNGRWKQFQFYLP